MSRSKAGRPAHVPTDDTRNLVESLSGFGIPQDEIARLVGIDPKTLRFHYADQIELGSIKATAKVAQNLFTMSASSASCGVGCCPIPRASWCSSRRSRMSRREGRFEPS